MRSMWLLIGVIVLTGCHRDESARAYGAADRVWSVVELDSRPFDQTATLTFPEPGRISGTAPCNSYSASMTAPYPWFQADAIVVTKLSCPDIGAETAYLTALAEMTQSEVSGDVLILSNAQKREIVFRTTD